MLAFTDIYTKLSTNPSKIGRKFEKLDEKFISTKEIEKLMGLTRNKLRLIRSDQFANMPAPVNDDNKYFIYMRESMLKWIEYWQFIGIQARPKLDNKMACAFLRS